MVFPYQEKIIYISEEHAASIDKVKYSHSHTNETAGSFEMLLPLYQATQYHIS
jgi:hypothetical protein